MASSATVNGLAVPGAPVMTAALRDLRRRLREAELEVKGMRAERASLARRDRRVSPLILHHCLLCDASHCSEHALVCYRCRFALNRRAAVHGGVIQWGTRFKSPSEQASVAALISEPLVSLFLSDFMLSRDKNETLPLGHSSALTA